VGTPQFDTPQAVRKVMLNFVRVFLQFELERSFLHILWPMIIQQLSFDVGFCDTSKHFYPIRYEGFCLCQRPKTLVTSAWKVRHLWLRTAIPTIRIRRVGCMRYLEAY